MSLQPSCDEGMKKEGRSSYARTEQQRMEFCRGKEPRMEDRRETKTSHRGTEERRTGKRRARGKKKMQDKTGLIDDEIRQGGPMVCCG